jgi:tetrahydromethanopterin S-methyltransferase subunit B
MKSIKYLFIFTLFLSISPMLFAQNDDDNLSLSKGTIDNQFEYVLKKSGDFRGTNGQMYEAVNRNMLITLKAHTIDSLKTIHAKLESLNNTVEAQLKEIDGLKTSLSSTQSTLDSTNAEKNSMSLLGAQMSKTGYNVLMWTIIASLLALLLLFIYKFKNSNAITKKAKYNLAEIEEEFEEHRKTALEREQKVRRQLQDEINKQKKGK